MIAQFLGSPLVYNAWSLVHFPPRCRAIADVVGGRQRPRILDLGCGTGLLKKHLPDSEYTGIDNNPAYIAHARQRLAGRFILGDIFDLQRLLGSARFDFIVINGVLHHLDDRLLERLLRALPNLLEKVGQVIIIDHISDKSTGQINRFLLNHDRGTFSRSEQKFRDLFWNFRVDSFSTFTINAGPIALWNQGRFVLSLLPREASAQ